MRNIFVRPSVPVLSLLAGALVAAGCETEDPREVVPPGGVTADQGSNNGDERGLGQLCDDDNEEVPACKAGLTCFQGTCTPDVYAAACEDSPCGEGALCYARGTVDDDGLPTGDNLVIICGCPEVDDEQLEWNGITCVASEDGDGFPEFSGSTLGSDETCPGPEIQVGVPGATDCSETSFCDADSGGSCLAYNFSALGSFGGTSFEVSSEGEADTTVACTLNYELKFKKGTPDEEKGDPTLVGYTLDITGELAAAMVADATTVTVELATESLGETEYLIFPQESAPEPRSDSGLVSVVVNEDAAIAAIGGRVTLNSLGEEKEELEEGETAPDHVEARPDSGWVGGSYFIGLPDDQYISLALVAPCTGSVITEIEEEEEED